MATTNSVATTPDAAAMYRSLVRAAALKQIGVGVLWAAAGVAVTAATNGNFIFFGPVIFGAFHAAKGLWRLVKA